MATLTLRPNADGSVSWTKNSGATNYSCVDEAVADDATTEVHAGSAAVADTYELPDHSTEAGIINSVKLYIKGKTIDSSPALGGFFKCGITYSASTYTCGINHYTTLWTTYNYTWNLSPKTGVGWTWAEIDTLTIYLYGGYVAEWDGKS